MAGDWHRPVLLGPEHNTRDFSCGKPELDDFLINRALANATRGATRTHVVVGAPEQRVIGYYSMAATTVARSDLRTAKMRKNMPEAVPAVLLARLAVDTKHRDERLGEALLRAAVLTALATAERVGVACMLVHAMDDDARGFYLHYEFEPSPTDPYHLILLLQDLPQRLDL